MRFICESCKANLQIADEKIRGKRLIVRCKRCGVQIRIVDPALLPSQSGGKAVSSSSQSGGRPEAGPIRGSQSGGRPATGPIARASAPRRETDTESTRAMDSEVLEKALRASKAGDAAPRAAAVLAPRSEPPPPPPPPRETPAPTRFAGPTARVRAHLSTLAAAPRSTRSRAPRRTSHADSNFQPRPLTQDSAPASRSGAARPSRCC